MRLALLVTAVMTASGCGIGHLIHAGEPLQLGTSDTLFALSVHTNEYVTLTFCRDADYTSCLTTGMIARDQPVQVFQVPTGRYCLLNIHVNPGSGALGAIDHNIRPERSLCFAARANVITYPGDLDIISEHTEGIYWSIRPHWSSSQDIDQRLYTAYPDLRGRPLDESRPMRYRMQQR